MATPRDGALYISPYFLIVNGGLGDGTVLKGVNFSSLLPGATVDVEAPDRPAKNAGPPNALRPLRPCRLLDAVGGAARGSHRCNTSEASG